MNKDKDFLPTCHIGFGFFLATHARVTTVHFGFAVPCSFSATHPLPSPLLRQCIISCLLNTWRQSQWGNYWGHSHVCTQPSLTDCTSFRVEKRLCCCKGRSGLMIGPWHVKYDTTNVSECRANKGWNLLLLFHQTLDLELCQGLGWGRIISCS